MTWIKNTLQYVPRGTFLYTAFALTSCCVSVQQQNSKKLKTLLSKFQNKSPNELYKSIGQPDTYRVISDEKGNIKYGTATYNYVYNFNNNNYDCMIDFITNKQQNKIVNFNISSSTCDYIVNY